MKIYKKENVYDAALSRIRTIFDEFKNVVVGFSGGKDSTVTLQLALIVAREKDRLPLKVAFLDQEAEWECTIDYVREVMSNPDIEPLWYQMPFKLFNATSTEEQWLECWDLSKEKDWIRPKEPGAIVENVYKCDRFAELFTKIFDHDYPNEPAAYLAGVRCEESPTRFVGLTHHACYKWMTWGKVLNKKTQHFTFYPLYDWSYTDVWKAIFDNSWAYCKLYDYQYMYGVPVQGMRVSNVHHETAVHALFYLQEIEAANYSKIVNRIKGIDTAGKSGKDDFFVKDLPFMFKDWKEYRDFLVVKLVKEDQRHLFDEKFAHMDEQYADMANINILHKAHVQTILTNDFYFTKLTNFERSPSVYTFRKFKKNGIKSIDPKFRKNRFIKIEDQTVNQEELI